MSRENTVAISDLDAHALVGEPLLTVEQVAQLLHCSVSNLSKWRLIGRGPRFVRIGVNVRYRPADIKAFIAENIRSSTSEEPPAA
jgi:predicted DNA-binding transcriptional regulator AlpA